MPDLLLALVDDFGPTAVEEPSATAQSASSSPSPDAIATPRCAVAWRRASDVSAVDVDDEDWARRSQENLHADHRRPDHRSSRPCAIETRA